MPRHARYAAMGGGAVLPSRPMKVPPFTSGPAENRTDYCMRRKGARQLARVIEAAWAESGYEVRCRVAPVHTDDGRIVCYTITSDLRNGLPR